MTAIPILLPRVSAMRDVLDTLGSLARRERAVSVADVMMHLAFVAHENAEVKASRSSTTPAPSSAS